ncbi:MAG: hypothetical protein L3J29_02500 [Cyclobacteriaceae bacterium]|nr:hypothetical protein [Cyclobacteriaceae bacterium]
MTTWLATLISYVFHPLLMCTYLITLLFFIAPYSIMPVGFSFTSGVVLGSLIFITTFIIPVLSLFILKMSGSISSMSLERKEERLTPMIYTAVMYGVTAYMFSSKLELGEMISVYLGISTMLILLTGVITIFWKISLHGIGIGGFVGFLLGLNQQSRLTHFDILLPLLFVIGALIISSRLKLNAHSPQQVYGGFVLGIFISFAAIIIYIA